MKEQPKRGKLFKKDDEALKRKAAAAAATPGTEEETEETIVEGAAQVVAKEKAESEFLEKIITIKRVTKVTKGGKKLSFSALAVVGNQQGMVGYSLGKGSEVSIAIKKALIKAKKNMVTVPMKGTTIPHEILGECGAASVMLKPASEGTGVIAAGPVRAICDGVGIRDILTKCHKSNNPVNVIKATIDGLMRLKSVPTTVTVPSSN